MKTTKENKVNAGIRFLLLPLLMVYSQTGFSANNDQHTEDPGTSIIYTCMYFCFLVTGAIVLFLYLKKKDEKKKIITHRKLSQLGSRKVRRSVGLAQG